GTTNTLPAVAITNGLFSVPLDFGTGAFGTQSRYLHIAVRPSGDPGAFISLSPRTAVMPSPVALSVAASGVNTDSVADGSVTRAKISDFGQYYSGVWTSNEFVFLPALSLPQTLFNKGIGAGPTISQSGIYNVRIKLKWLTQF